MGFKEFESRVRNDKAFAAKFQGITDPAAVIALAKSEGYTLSMNDFNEEMTDDELDNVAGGASDIQKEHGKENSKNRAIVAIGPGVAIIIV